jgi:hydroxypyruvate isomerase
MDAANHDAYIETTHRAAQWARRLGCPNLIVTTGNEVAGVSREAQFDVLHRGLERVAGAASDGGVVAVLEPLNTKVDHAGYFLDHGVDAFRLVREINAPSLRVLYDIYHMQIMDGDLIATIEANLDVISHFHVADVPGRHEPGTGEINYANVFRRIDGAGYGGFVGLEFRPSSDHDAALMAVRALVA